MSSAAYALPLRLERRYSRALARTVIVVHALALVELGVLDLPWWLKLTLAMAVLIQAVITWRHHENLAAPGAIRAIVWTADGRWELSGAGPGCCRSTAWMRICIGGCGCDCGCTPSWLVRSALA